jgi:Zn-dependent protease with chaperone function
MISVLAAILAAGIAVPHVLRLQRVQPVTAAALWLNSLALRALAGVLVAVYLVFFLPRAELFSTLTHWCLHTMLPFVSDQLAVEGHGIGDAVLYLPGAFMTFSLVVVCLATARSARAARHVVDHDAVRGGPRDSLIVGGSDVAFAVAGIARPRILVSAGALTRLDDDELDAALNHEQAHIARGHRFVVLLALGFRALGRLVPGSGHALAELAFHLERDADRSALRLRDDRLALASVICKAADGEESQRLAAIARIDGTGVRERLRQLLDDQPPEAVRPAAAALNGLAVAMVACTLLLAAMVPTAAVAGARGDAHQAHHALHCEH